MLYWQSSIVLMPKNIKALEVYGGYRALNTVIVLCRTTETIKETQMRPPFFCYRVFCVLNTYYNCRQGILP